MRQTTIPEQPAAVSSVGLGIEYGELGAKISPATAACLELSYHPAAHALPLQSVWEDGAQAELRGTVNGLVFAAAPWQAQCWKKVRAASCRLTTTVQAAAAAPVTLQVTHTLNWRQAWVLQHCYEAEQAVLLAVEQWTLWRIAAADVAALRRQLEQRAPAGFFIQRHAAVTPLLAVPVQLRASAAKPPVRVQLKVSSNALVCQWQLTHTPQQGTCLALAPHSFPRMQSVKQQSAVPAATLLPGAAYTDTTQYQLSALP